MGQQQMIETVCRRIFPQRRKDDVCKPSDCNLYPRVHKKCRILEKTEKQLDYVRSSITDNIFLKACPGSGKTEVVGMKAAYEFQAWKQKNNGIAILTFTNNAADVIRERVQQFAGIEKSSYPHFIGTIDSWLHGYLAHPFGYLITDYQGEKGDRSIKIIEEDISEGWINNYKCPTPYYFLPQNSNVPRAIPLYANMIRYDAERNGWEVKFPNSNEYLSDEQYFESRAFKVFRSNNPWLTLAYMRQGFLNVKQKLLQDGFATYQDIEWIGYRLLKEKDGFSKKLSRRFPFIIIDECQDLSWIQIEMFSFLKQHGMSLHLVGDLNQAIYEFKKVDPQKVHDFISHHNFKSSQLSDNFRSCQPIVDLCQKIVSGENVIGKGKLPEHGTCICFQYGKDGISALPNRFEEHLKNVRISIEKSAILARGWSTVYKLYGLDKDQTDKPQFQIAMAIYLWSQSRIELTDEALKHSGRFIANKYFKDRHRNSRQYYCPSIVGSPMRWRFFLARILNECLKSNCGINDLNKTWEDWAQCIRTNFVQIIKSHLFVLQYDLTEEQFRKIIFNSPPRFGKKRVVDTLIITEEKKSFIKITTIHDIKGKTFDAVLLVSSPDARGSNGGYWHEWLKDTNSQPARFSYVASSRPKELLAWAIPETKDLTKIKKLGFNIEN